MELNICLILNTKCEKTINNLKLKNNGLIVTNVMEVD